MDQFRQAWHDHVAWKRMLLLLAVLALLTGMVPAHAGAQPRIPLAGNAAAQPAIWSHAGAADKPKAKVKFEVTGITVYLNHPATQLAIDIAKTPSDLTELVNFLKDIGVEAPKGLFGLLIPLPVPWSNAVKVLAMYLRAEAELMARLDRGHGVKLTLPWPAIAFGQLWLIIPTSR